LSTCLSGWSGSGTSPSWKADTFPPGNTCAEANEVDVCTRCSSNIWFVGDINNRLELGRGAIGVFLPAAIPFAVALIALFFFVSVARTNPPDGDGTAKERRFRCEIRHGSDRTGATMQE